VTAASMETSIRNQIEDKLLNYDGGYSHCGVYVMAVIMLMVVITLMNDGIAVGKNLPSLKV